MIRRNFIKHFSALAVSSQLLQSCNIANAELQKNFNWNKIAKSYKYVKAQKIINFNTGSATVLPDFVFEELIKIEKRFAFEPPYQVWIELQNIYKNIKTDLANKLNVNNTEIALVRNCTEALNNIIFGIPIKNKDKVIVSKNEYPFLTNALLQRKKRKNFNLNIIDFELNETDQNIINIYKNEIEKGCNYLILTAVDYHSGRILPIQEIIKFAKQNDVKVIVDGAHAFGMIKQNLQDLNVDYYATSLHKWYNAPLGNGLLFVKEKLIPSTFSLLSNDKNVDDKIIKFEYSGTKPYYNIFGIAAASSFLNTIGGIEKKEERLKYLTNYAYNKLKEIDNISFLAPIKCLAAIISFKFKNINSYQLKNKLEKDFNIHIKSVTYKKQQFLRLSNNLFISEKEIDYLISSIKKTIA